MKALRFHHYGAPSVLSVDEVPLPRVGASEALVKVTHAGINYADTERRRGLYQREVPLPVTLGSECVGTLADGRRVVAIARNAQAGYCAVPRSELHVLPPGVDDVTAAACFLKGLTAWHVLFTAGTRVSSLEGKTVGVTAAAGGVGLLLVQLAKRAGARVVGVTSTREKSEIARAHGADTSLQWSATLEGEVLDATGGQGVDVWCDSVGQALAPLAVATLAPRGRWVSFGDASGPLPPLEPSGFFEKSLTFTSWWLRAPMAVDLWQTGVNSVLQLLEGRKIGLPSELFTFETAHEAHRRLEGRQTVGALVLRVD